MEAVADLILFLRGHLSEGLAVLVEEEGIVAEAAFALQSGEQRSFAFAPDDAGLLPRQRQRHGADEAAGAVGNAVHVFQQQLVIGPVVAVLPGVAGAVDARRAAQRIHGKAAVVRQRGKAGGLHDAFGLDAGVFLKGGAVFVNIALKAHFLHGDGLTHAPEQGGQLLKLMGVAAGHHHHGQGQQVAADAAKRLPLGLHQAAHSGAARIQQAVKLPIGKGAAFAGALQLNKFSPMIHDEIHVRLGAGIFRVAEIQQRFVLHDARADGGHLGNDGIFVQQAVLHELVDRHDQRHIRAGDAGGTGAAIGGEHVAVQRDGALAQLGQIHRLTQGAADEPLNLHTAAILLDAVPGFAPPGRGGQHGVFRRDPALPLIPKEGRDGFLHAGGADHAGLSGGNQAASGGGLHKAGLNGAGTGLHGGAVSTNHESLSC